MGDLPTVELLRIPYTRLSGRRIAPAQLAWLVRGVILAQGIASSARDRCGYALLRPLLTRRRRWYVAVEAEEVVGIVAVLELYQALPVFRRVGRTHSLRTCTVKVKEV